MRPGAGAATAQLCQKAGLAKLGSVSLDGTKIKASAALAANRKLAALEANRSEWRFTCGAHNLVEALTRQEKAGEVTGLV